MKRKFIGMLVVLVLFGTIRTIVLADELDDLLSRQSSLLELSDMQALLDESEYSDVFGSVRLDDILASLQNGSAVFDGGDVITKLLLYFVRELYANIWLLLELVVFAILSTLITSMSSAVKHDSVGNAAFLVCFTLVAGIGVKAFSLAASAGMEFIETISAFIKMFVPLIMLLLVSGGAVLSAAVFEPMLLGASSFITYTASGFLLPLVFISTAAGVTESLSEGFNLSRFCELIRRVVKWSLGIILTIFTGIGAIQSFTAPMIDGIAHKTAKYAISSFVPAVGGILAETLEMVAGCSLIIKNSVGVMGMLALAAICLVPLIKMAAQIALFHIAAALIQPLADRRITNCITTFASSLTLIFIIMLSVELMFIINAAITISAGSTALLTAR